ncbi:MAG: hypothetical protein LUH82_04850 [Clostridiales bacterium]|nr:hypothetical protein [Clostridiales bacterium]
MDEEKDLSIEEILQEAEAVLARMNRKSQETIEKIKSVEEPIDISVPESEKTRAADSDEDVKEFVPAGVQKQPSSEPGEDMQKTINVKASGDTINVSRAKKAFFAHNTKHHDFSAEPPATIEKSATIKSKSRFNKTSDLQEIPTILAVEELENVRIRLGGEPKENAAEPNKNDYDNSAQIKITGFDDEMDNIPTIDEAVAEQMLKRRREEKVNKFRLFAEEEVPQGKKGENEKLTPGDCRNRGERTAALESFFKKKTSLQTVLCLTVFFGAVLLYLTLFENTQHIPSFLNIASNYCIVVAALYFIILLINVNNIFHGFNFKRGVNSDFPVAITSLLVLAHTCAVYFKPEMLTDGGSYYPSAAVLLLFFSTLGKYEMIVRIIENFEFLTSGGDKYTVEQIVNEVDAAIIARNLLTGEALLKYSVKTDVPTSFIEISCADEPADRIARILFPVMFVLNAILFGVLYGMHGNLNFAFNIFVAGMVISCPAVAMYASNATLKNVCRSISPSNAMVCGFEGAHMLHNSNALVMEASDLFGARSCDLHGIKTFNGAKIDDAILLTAAVIIKTKSPLANVFDDVIVGKQAILPQVDDVIYEDKMGTSAWIYQKKILVGNRDLLIAHGVTVPKEDYEKAYTKNGRKTLYLAVAGKISAMFIVSYSANPKLKKELKKLEKSGITILLKSTDPYINDESLKQIFDLPDGFIRVMAASNARIFEKYSEATVKKSPAYAVHNGSAMGFIKAIRASDNIVGAESLIFVLVSFGAALGFGVMALLGIINGASCITALNVIIFQAVWSIFVAIISKIKTSAV